MKIIYNNGTWLLTRWGFDWGTHAWLESGIFRAHFRKYTVAVRLWP